MSPYRSQIIAMSEAVFHDISLAYDPSIKLNMQSANGKVDQSLSLSCNIPCKINTITLYLQIHIIQSPAYDILLGQPFDVLTESTVKNFPNEDQTITIVDPNAKCSIIIPMLRQCKGISICFLTSPLLSYSPPVHMYSLSSPLYYLQGLQLKPTTSILTA
jgi:hypothetical protein